MQLSNQSETEVAFSLLVVRIILGNLIKNKRWLFKPVYLDPLNVKICDAKMSNNKDLQRIVYSVVLCQWLKRVKKTYTLAA